MWIYIESTDSFLTASFSTAATSLHADLDPTIVRPVPRNSMDGDGEFDVLGALAMARADLDREKADDLAFIQRNIEHVERERDAMLREREEERRERVEEKTAIENLYGWIKRAETSWKSEAGKMSAEVKAQQVENLKNSASSES